MIVTLDANVLASGLIASAGGTIASIIEAWRAGRFEVRLSQHVYDELVRTLAAPYFADRVPVDTRARYLAFVDRHTTLVPIVADVTGIATHPEDDLVLATAISASAEYLVTGDVRFRNRVPRYLSVQLIGPIQFLAILTVASDN